MNKYEARARDERRSVMRSSMSIGTAGSSSSGGRVYDRTAFETVPHPNIIPIALAQSVQPYY